MLNHIILIGRLTHDPELRYTPSGTATTRFSLAVDRQYQKKGEEKKTDFFAIVVWGTQAENCANFLSKGSLVAVSGRMEIDSYTNKNGEAKKDHHVTAETVKFLSPGKNNGTEQRKPVAQVNTYLPADDDDLPF